MPRKGQTVERHFRGDRLHKLRIGEHLTQKDLANQIGASEKQVNRWEKHDVEPTGHHLLQLARYFNVTIEYLLGVSSDPVGYQFPRELSPLQRRIIEAMDRGDLPAINLLLAQFVREQLDKDAPISRAYPDESE